MFSNPSRGAFTFQMLRRPALPRNGVTPFTGSDKSSSARRAKASENSAIWRE